MENVIFLVVDSFIYNKIGCTKYGSSPTPFIDSLKDKSIWCTNMYSQGPYTEAGNKALLTGDNSLNNGGYMHNLNDSENIYLDVFKKAGYETYDFILPYYLYSKKDFNNIDHQFFTSDFVFTSVTSNRLSYFAKRKKEGKISDWDYQDTIKQIDLTFEGWFNFLEHKELSRYACIERLCKNFDFDKAKNELSIQFSLYQRDKRKYADDLLDNIDNHALLNITKCNYSDFILGEFINRNVFENHAKFFKTLRNKQFIFSIKNGVHSWSNIIKSLLSNDKEDHYFKYMIYSLLGCKFAKSYKKDEFYQMLPSCRVLTRKVLEEFGKPNDGRPRMFHLHPEELHNRFNYFSFDINSSSLINHEFSLFEDYLAKVNNRYRGQLLYDLALIYVDDCIKELYEGLEKIGVLDNTLLVITADHGSFYDCVPVRHTFTNTCNTENFHIPAIFYNGSNPKPKVIESYHTSNDILPTIYDFCGIIKPSNIDGISLLDKSNNPWYAITEYVGNGCPDLRKKKISFIIRDKKYMIQYMINAFEPFDDGSLLKVFDIENDILELNNLSNNSNFLNKIEYLLNVLKIRQEEIRNSYLNSHIGYIFTDGHTD